MSLLGGYLNGMWGGAFSPQAMQGPAMNAQAAQQQQDPQGFWDKFGEYMREGGAPAVGSFVDSLGGQYMGQTHNYPIGGQTVNVNTPGMLGMRDLLASISAGGYR